jgi:hypothetical protein
MNRLQRSAVLRPRLDQDAAQWRRAVVVAGGTCSDNQLRRVSSLIVKLKNGGVWSSLDRLWLFAAENSTQALVDLVTRSTATAVNSPTFTAMQGYAGNGSTSYINTSYNPSVGPQYTQNSAHYAVWQRIGNSTVGQNGWTGATTAPNIFYKGISGGGAGAGQININGSGVGGLSQTVGHLMGSRLSGTTTIYASGVSAGTDSGATSAITSAVSWVCAANNSGAVYNPGNGQFFCFHAGAGLTAAQSFAIFTALDNYRAAIGA